MKANNPMARRLEDDREQRRRAVEETDSSFIVEASAGTGKTHTLIDRIVRLVLVKGPAGPPLSLSQICAITFTEKAAGEMKIRLRQYFEQTLFDPQASSECLSRAREAIDDLEAAAISTFHSFAVSLLKERPIEALLDPHFIALDEIRSELYFREVWEPWIGRALEDRHPVLETALRSGIRLERLESIARTLRLKWLAVRNLDCGSPLSEEHYREKIQAFLKQGKELLHQAIKSEDKLAAHLDRALNWLEHPDRDAAGLSKPGNTGNKANWTGGKETVRTVQEFLRELVEFQSVYKLLPAQQLLVDVIRWIKKDFMQEEWQKRKQAEGLLDFDDQLYLARDLLMKQTVRREFQERYKTLLVDEFQDTDPVQSQIVLLLSSTDFEEKDIDKLRPAPGRLFIVGDPKQSIYRFRNADIETYLDIVKPDRREFLGLNRLELTTNFRSVPSILRFVDAAFRDVMKTPDDGGRYQPEYLAFDEHGYRKTELDPPSVYFLGDNLRGSDLRQTSRQFVECESKRIAGLIRTMQGSASWKIRDAEEKEGSRWRVPRYGDISILLPVITYAYVLEEALRDLEIPYVLEGGKFYYARSEVSSAITVLRAVANPNDTVALYGSLRSIFFGFSDEELLQARTEGQEFDYRQDAPPESPLKRSYEILMDLHRHRHERRASETFEILLQKTGAREVLATRGFQSLANLNKLGRMLRTLQGENTFSQVVELLAAMDEERLAESESRLMEERSDAVRIMSIHKAKGLDFPIVFIAALGLKKQFRGNNLLADPRERKLFALSIGSKDTGVQTPGWDALDDGEKKREIAELTRLLYVALTRARDHLILSTHTAAWRKPDNAAQWIPATDATRLSPLGPFLEDCLLGDTNLVRLIDAGELDASVVPPKTAGAQTGKNWRAIAESEYKALHALLRDTPAAGKGKTATDTAVQDDDESNDREPQAVENRAVRLGLAFHEAMERVDIFYRKDWTQMAQELNTRYKLDRENARKLEEMMHISLSSELLERARAAASLGKRVLRELPFVRRLDQGTIEEGKIDLLFEEEDGWVLVDYKTDWVSRDDESAVEFFRKKYSGQIREYIEAVQSLSLKATSAYLLLARTGNAVKLL